MKDYGLSIPELTTKPISIHIGVLNRKKLTEIQNVPGYYLNHIRIRRKTLTLTRLWLGSKRNEEFATLSILVHVRI